QHPGLNAGISRERPGALQRFYREPGFTGLNASPEGLLTEEEAEPTHPGRGGKGWPRSVGTGRGTFLPAGPAAGAAPARGAVPAAVATAVPLAVPMPVGSPGEGCATVSGAGRYRTRAGSGPPRDGWSADPRVSRRRARTGRGDRDG